MVNVRSSALTFGFAVVASAVAVAGHAENATVGAKCDRKAFGGYIQIDYMDTRSRLLVERAVGPYTIVSSASGKKRVSRGTWIDPYTRKLFHDVDAGQMHVDHVIPVCWAWYHGADRWSREKRRAFYNDIKYLEVVEAGLNREKGMQGPDTFLPVTRTYACEYIYTFLDGVAEYGLVLSEKEIRSIASSRDEVCAGTEIAVVR